MAFEKITGVLPPPHSLRSGNAILGGLCLCDTRYSTPTLGAVFSFSFIRQHRKWSDEAIYIHENGWNIQNTDENWVIHLTDWTFIPRFYSNLSSKKGLIYCQLFPRKKFVLFLSEILPQKKNTNWGSLWLCNWSLSKSWLFLHQPKVTNPSRFDNP